MASGNSACPMYVAGADHDSSSAVVVASDAWGPRPLMDQLCDWLASELGQRVVAPDYTRTLGTRESTDRVERIDDFDDETVLADLVAAADASGCDRVTLLGFCLGGYYAFKAAATHRFAAIASCYGSIEIPDMWSSHRLHPLTALREATCPVLDVVAGLDEFASARSHIEALAQVPGMPVVVYPAADHGFVHDGDRPSRSPTGESHGGYGHYQAACAANFVPGGRGADAQDCWQRLLTFLQAR